MSFLLNRVIDYDDVKPKNTQQYINELLYIIIVSNKLLPIR